MGGKVTGNVTMSGSGVDRARAIRGGRAPHRATIRDVASQAGVSINTVSRVVNDRPDVHPATRSRVQRVIAQLGYRPNGLARSLLRRRSRTIGLIVTDCTNPNTARQIRAVQQHMVAASYAVMIFDTQERADQQEAALAILEEKAVDGIILTPAAPTPSVRGVAQRLPLVLLNRELDGIVADVVVNDNTDGARAAIEHLIAAGHRRIACIMARRDVSTARERLRGYRAALEAAGIAYDDRLVVRTDIELAAGLAATRTLMRRRPAPTAIFTYNDQMAVGALTALEHGGYRVPEDVALVGYDDIVYAPYLHVPLTTVAQPTEEMGITAARLLLERLAGAEAPPRRVVLAPELIARASSGGDR